MAHYKPSTLAKTLAYILIHTPGKHGLFWNPDGTMPWKELYWALQQDPSLRFVRETHFREIAFLGIPNFPVRLEGKLLRMTEGVSPPPLVPATDVPERLHHACRRAAYLHILEKGLEASARPLLPLFSDPDLARSVGRRRDPGAILLEILAQSAQQAGIIFFKSGDGLFLVENVPPQHLFPPKLKESLLLELAEMGRKEKKKEAGDERIAPASAPGSFFLDPRHLEASTPRSSRQDRKQKEKRGPDWKRAARKDRGKRAT